jgi:hypothetical protein
MSAPIVNQLTNELIAQWRSFQNRMAKLRQKLDFTRAHYYLTQQCEPVLGSVEPGIAWTVKGLYGATLVTRNLPICDVDRPAARATELEAVLEEWRTHVGSAHEASGYSFRVYKTFGGLRVICTSRTVDLENEPDAAWFRAIGAAIQADRAYMVISGRQKCCRARLCPKPSQFRWGQGAWLLKLSNRGRVRACKFKRVVGADEVLEELREQISFHDHQTEAIDSDKELV